MAHLLRIVALLLLVLSSSAHALIPKIGTLFAVDDPRGSGAAVYTGATASAACEASLTGWVAMFGPGGWQSLRVVTEGMVCTAYGKPGANNPETTIGGRAIRVTANACPANSTASGTACACTPPYVENSAQTACEAPPDPCLALAGQSAGFKNWEGEAQEFYFCDTYNETGQGKCVAKASKQLAWEDPPKSGHYISQGAAVYTGGRSTSCDGTGGGGSDAAPSTPPDSDGKPPIKPGDGEAAPSPCPQGQAAGEVNGTRVCAPVGPDVDATDKKEIKHPDGSTTTQTSESRCRDGKCTTDTTTCQKAAGSDAQTCETTQTVQGQAAHCAQNKGSNACTGDGDGSAGSFSGDCVAGFKAEGDDPVLNAMALEVYKQNCKINPKDEELVLANAERVKTGNQTLTNPNNSTVTLSSASFDTSDALNAGSSCISDVNVSVFHGSSVMLPFSRACDAFPMLGTLLVGLSFLAAAVIVMRG